VADGTTLTNNVSANGNETDPDLTNNDDDEPTDVDRSSDVSVVKTDSGANAVAGEQYVYTLTVSNAGPSDATGIVVSDTLPAGMSFVSATGATCAAVGQLVTCSAFNIADGAADVVIAITVDVASSVADGTTLTNNVSANGNETDPDLTNNDDDEPTDVDRSSDLRIAKDDGVTQVTAGDGATYTYTITVNNDGPSDADNVTVSEDSFPAGFDMGTVSSSQGGCDAFDCNLGTITAGGSATITVAYTVPSDTQAGFETNTVSVDSDEPDPDGGDNSASDTNQVLTSADLRIEKIDLADPILAGYQITYQITVYNDGPSDADNVSVSDTLPAGVTLISTSGCSEDTSGVPTCSLGTIVVNDNASYTIVVEVDATSAGTITNSATASSDETDPNSNNNTATEDTFIANPAISIDKVTNGADGSEILAGSPVTWTYTVANEGNVPLSNVSVSDSDLGAISGPVSGDDNNDGILDLTETWVYEATGTAQAGDYANTGLASGDYTDDHNNSETANDSDDSSYFGGDPAISILKTFTEDSVIAGNAAIPFNVTSSFTLSVTNEGNVPLSDVSISDLVDDHLEVTGVSVTLTAAGSVDCSASAGQSVSCIIPTLAVDESAEITVNFKVDASEPEDLGVSNTADVEGDYTDDHNNTETVTDTSTDTIDILTEIELSILKTFYRYDDDGIRVEDGTIEQGTNGFFELTVANSGPSDALGVIITDTVSTVISVTDVIVVSGNGDCGAPAQYITCTFNIPVGTSVTVTVQYQAAEFLNLDEPPTYDTTEGDEFRFVFINGYILQGSSDTNGEATLELTDPVGNTTILPYTGTRNDFFFDPPAVLIDGVLVDNPGFIMHLSCSDSYFGGYSDGAGGPVSPADDIWQIASYSILRYNQSQGFFKGCGDVVVAMDVPNTAYADGTDSNSPPESEEVSSTATVQVIRQLKIEIRNEPVIKGKKMDVLLVNTGEDILTITKVELTWNAINGGLINGDLVSVDFGANNTIWTGADDAPDATITDFLAGSDLTIDPGEGLKLGFFFQSKTKGGEYMVTVTLEGGLTTEVTTISAVLQ